MTLLIHLTDRRASFIQGVYLGYSNIIIYFNFIMNNKLKNVLYFTVEPLWIDMSHGRLHLWRQPDLYVRFTCSPHIDTDSISD